MNSRLHGARIGPAHRAIFKRYLLVGVTAYAVEMTALYALRHGLGYGPISSVAVSFWIGFVTAFVMQKLITFRNYEKTTRIIAKQLVGYSLLVAWNYGFTLLVVDMFSRHASVFALRTSVIVITTSWNFVAYKFLFASAGGSRVAIDA